MILLTKLASSDTLQFLNEKISLLELKIDSLQKFDDIKTLTTKLNEQANIISHVNGFYESAWLKLIIIISILGIIIPILIQYFQRNNLKVVIDYLTKEQNLNFETKIKELAVSNQENNELLTNKIDIEINRLSENYSYISNEIEATLFYHQGKQNLSNGNFNTALKDFYKSTIFWIKSSKPTRAVVTLENIAIAIMGLKTKENFDTACRYFNIDWEEFMSDISAVSSKYGFEDKLNKIRSNIIIISKQTNSTK